MAGATKKLDTVSEIVRLLTRWKQASLRRRSFLSRSDSDEAFAKPTRRAPSGSLPLYVGPERKRFVVPARFLKFPVFVGLLKKSEEEFGFRNDGGLVLPCEVGFFREIVECLKKDEHKYAKLSLEQFAKMVSEDMDSDSRNCKGTAIAFTPLLQETRA